MPTDKFALLDPKINHPGQRVLRIAHRGASAYALENSAEALQIAAEMGADMVESDLRVTADDWPVIAHEESLKTVYGIDGTVSDFAHDELLARTPILSFESLVQRCHDLELAIYLDIKTLNKRAAKRVFDAADQYDYARKIIFSSFRPDYVADIKAYRPDVFTSILFHSVHIDPVGLAHAVRADYVHPCWEDQAKQPHTLLTPEWLAQVRAAELGIITWHEERPSEIAALFRLGVNGICSDQPDLLLKQQQSLA